MSKGKTATNSEDLMKRSNFLFKKKKAKTAQKKKKKQNSLTLSQSHLEQRSQHSNY